MCTSLDNEIVALDRVVTIYQVDIGYFLLYYISVEMGLPYYHLM